jgi:hypothetical protein
LVKAYGVGLYRNKGSTKIRAPQPFHNTNRNFLIIEIKIYQMGGETKGNETKAIKWQWFSPPYIGSRYENKFKEKIKSLMGVVEGLP